MGRYGLYDLRSGQRLRDSNQTEYEQFKQATGGYYILRWGLCDVRREVTPPPVPSESNLPTLPKFEWFDSIPPKKP